MQITATATNFAAYTAAGLTEGQIKALEGIAFSQYNNGDPTEPTWSTNLSDDINVAPRSLAGFISGLVKKGLAVTDGTGKEATVALTEAGAALLRAARPEVYAPEAAQVGSPESEEERRANEAEVMEKRQELAQQDNSEVETANSVTESGAPSQDTAATVFSAASPAQEQPAPACKGSTERGAHNWNKRRNDATCLDCGALLKDFVKERLADEKKATKGKKAKAAEQAPAAAGMEDYEASDFQPTITPEDEQLAAQGAGINIQLDAFWGRVADELTRLSGLGPERCLSYAAYVRSIYTGTLEVSDIWDFVTQWGTTTRQLKVKVKALRKEFPELRRVTIAQAEAANLSEAVQATFAAYLK